MTSRRLVMFLCFIIMLALAVVVARLFSDPVPPVASEEVAPVGDSVSGSLQTEPQVSLPSPLPSPDAMVMSSGDSTRLPVTQVVETPSALPAAPAPEVSDVPPGSVLVTEAPAPAGAVELPAGPRDAASSAAREDQSKPAADEGASPASSTPTPAAQPVPEVSTASATPAPDGSSSQAAAPPAPDGAQGGDNAPSARAGSAVKAPAAPPAPGKSDKALKPGTLVTKSTLPGKAGARVVTTAVLTMDGDVVTLNLEGNSAMRGKSFMLTGPDRVVLDIEGEWQVEAPRVPSNRMVKVLRTGRQGAATRLVFDMRVKPVKVNVTNPGANSLELTIR